jgi:NAD-specific glutamate dehydrogenase
MTLTARSPEQKKLEVIEAVAALARERISARPAVVVEAFVRRYYAGVSAEDLCEREVPDLYGAALAHFGLLRERRPGELKLRVYNPGFEEHGWQSTHTVVEMATDDMPFLVDSLVMELNRHGATIPPHGPSDLARRARRQGTPHGDRQPDDQRRIRGIDHSCGDRPGNGPRRDLGPSG